MGIVSVITRSDTPVYLEFTEATFNQIALFVEFSVEWYLFFAVGFGRNHRLHMSRSDEGADGVRIVALVGNYGLSRLAFKQGLSALTVGFFTTGKDETQGPAQRITKHVDFRSQSSTGSPQSLVASPLFPVAACW